VARKFAQLGDQFKGGRSAASLQNAEKRSRWRPTGWSLLIVAAGGMKAAPLALLRPDEKLHARANSCYNTISEPFISAHGWPGSEQLLPDSARTESDPIARKARNFEEELRAHTVRCGGLVVARRWECSNT